MTRSLLGIVLLLLVGRSDARAGTLGKGLLLEEAGSLTSDPKEVISGRTSIKGSYHGSATFTRAVFTDRNFITFAASQTYTFTLNYRVLEQGNFTFGFYSHRGAGERNFVANGTFRGGPGTSGTATLTVRLEAYDDYEAAVDLESTGSVVVDDIRITDSTGQLVVSEDAEGPTVVPGPLNLQLTDATSVPFGANVFFLRSAAARDLDGDGYPEAILTLSDGRNGSTTPIPIVAMQGNGQLRIATSDYFPAGIPTVKHSPMTVFADLNRDGLQDIIFAEAGGDPGGAGRISVALNLGGGRYRDVSNLIPDDQQNTRSYAIVVGDVLSDGQVRILLPDNNGGTNTALLRWNGNGFDELRNWVPQSLWKDLIPQWMNMADFDGDGRQDLLLSGTMTEPNVRIAYGATAGFSLAGFVTMPDGPWGHTSPSTPGSTAQGAEVQPVVVADFNNDGRPDIFAAERKWVWHPPSFDSVASDDSFQVLMNQGSRQFIDVTSPNYVNLGDRTYFSLLPIDVNNDGFVDIVGLYEEILPQTFKGLWGTTFFLNDGTGRFQPVDGSKLLGATTSPSNGRVWNLGSFIPTLITPQRIEGIVAETVGINCVVCTSLNVYKVVGNGSIGTGPNFIDPATRGVPGFNELFYLNQHPEVAEAVRRGDYRSGLDHYLVEGRAKGYATHAPNARVQQ